MILSGDKLDAFNSGGNQVYPDKLTKLILTKNEETYENITIAGICIHNDFLLSIRRIW